MKFFPDKHREVYYNVKKNQSKEKRKMKYLTYFILGLILVSPVMGYTIRGDEVLIDSQYANLTVYPHTKIYEEQFQFLNITAKGQPGDLCMGAITDNPLSGTTLELWNGAGWTNLNPFIDHQVKNNRHIYYSTSSLHFDAYESRLLRLNIKSGFMKFKYDVWAWSPKNGYSCTDSIIQDQTNFLVNLDPWYSVTNQTSGHLALSNYSYETTFSNYPASEYIQPYNTTASNISMAPSYQYNFNYSFSKPVDFYWNSTFGTTTRYIPIKRSYFNGSLVQLAVFYSAPGGGTIEQFYYYNNGTAWVTIVNYTQAVGAAATHEIVNLSFFNNITNTSHWTPNNYTWNVGPADNGYGYNSFQANVTVPVADDGKLAHNIGVPFNNFELIAKLTLDSDLGVEYIRVNINPGYYFYYRRASARARIDGLNGPVDSTNGLTLNIPRLLRFTKINGWCSWYDALLVYPTNWTLRYNASCSANWPPTDITLWCEDATCKFDYVLYRELPGRYEPAPFNADASFIYYSADSTQWGNTTIQWFKDGVLNVTDQFDNPNDYAEFNRTLTPGVWYANVTVWDINGNNASNLTNDLYCGIGNLTIHIYDEDTGALITSAIDVLLTDESFQLDNSTSTGHINYTHLATDNYTATFSDTVYYTRHYPAYVYTGMETVLNAYLVNSSSEVVFTILDSVTGRVIEDATMTISKFIGGVWTTVAVFNSDVTGKIQFSFNTQSRYRFLVTESGYENKIFELNPIIFNSYQVYMTATQTVSDTSVFSGVTVYHSPKLFYEGLNDFTLIVAEPGGTLDSFGVNLSYPGGSFQGIYATSTGGTLIETINITGATFTDSVNVTIFYERTGDDQKTLHYQYDIIPVPTGGTIMANRDVTYGLGIIERVLISTLLVIAVSGTAAYFSNPIVGGVMGIFMLGYLAFVGFISKWLVYIPIIVGFLIIARVSGR